MNRIKTEYTFNQTEINRVKELSAELNLLQSTVRLLYARGYKDAAAINSFLNAGSQNFIDPFTLKGMKEFAERITFAAENDQTIVIYGDYDADGICGSAIMSLALKNMGLEPIVYIPERAEGYGLSIENIEKIADAYMPDLIITVDCGISSHTEAEYIHELGIDLIVTDHHELPDIPPACTIINPKLKDQAYPHDNLCGAGVALKCAYALDKNYAPALIDLAAVATVADSVPLVYENRDIVACGLDMIASKNCRAAIKLLMGENVSEINSQTIAYSIGPKINAAGRMGEASLAISLLLSQDPQEISALATQIIGLNGKRQTASEELFNEMFEKASTQYCENIIMLKSDKLSNGFIGIAASKLCERYHKPVIIFSQTDGLLKGSARSIDSINIYQAIDSARDLTVEFGGHSQAAGVTLNVSDFDMFFEKVNNYLKENYSSDDYIPYITVSDYIDSPIDKRFISELKTLEPFGVANSQPLFAYTAKNMAVKPLKDGTSHLLLNSPIGDIIYFSGAKYSSLLSCSFSKILVIEPNFSYFKGRQYIKTYLRAIETSPAFSEREKLDCLRNNLLQLQFMQDLQNEYQETDTENCQNKVSENACGYGTCFIINDPDNMAHFPELEGIRREVFQPVVENCANILLISPQADAASGFEQIIYLDEPLYSPYNTENILVNTQLKGYNFLNKIHTDRQQLLDVYFYLRDNPNIKGEDSVSVYIDNSPPYEPEHFIFALEVFLELNLINFVGNSLYIVKNAKSALENSRIYSAVQQKQAEVNIGQ